jgi:hypothetical protein
MAKLAALSACYNTVMTQFEALDAKELSDDEPLELLQLAKGVEAVRLAMDFFKVCDPPSTQVVDRLFRPIQHRAIDELARRRSRRKDGMGAHPADYVLTDSIWKAILAAIADVMIYSGKSREDTEKWLSLRLIGFPGQPQAKTVVDWRDQIVARMAKQQLESRPLDIMVAIFRHYRPTRERLSQAAAEKLAEEWLEEARLNAR